MAGNVVDPHGSAHGGGTVRSVPRARFTEIMQPGGAGVPLDEASLLISGAIQPGLDAEVWTAALDSFAAGCADDSADAVAHHLFASEHFVGNRSAYYDWRNSCLDRVIERRTGIPISLSVLMIEVARRVGVELVGVGMPAHFLVRLADDADVFFDPFDGGRRLDRAGARTVFESVTSGQVPWSEGYLEPTSNRDIVIRMLNNLKSVFAGRSDVVRLAIVMDLRSAVPELAELEADEITATSAIFN
jgi:regulator of sirC expression with transglutaminase-like and TPR domain